MVSRNHVTCPGRVIVPLLVALVLVCLGAALLSLWRHRVHVPAEVAYRSDVESAFSNLSIDLIGPTLSGGSVTSIAQLMIECGQRYPLAPPLFSTYRPMDIRNGEIPQYRLPARDYFWIRSWTGNDIPSTPLIWSYFSPPWGIDVVYLAIDGSVHHCSSNEFSSLVALLSSRVERAPLTK
jgi:hypothetical protein